MSQNPDVILQDVRNFTVKVYGRDPDERLLGTGVIISRAGLVATCAHVLRQGGIDPQTGRRAVVAVYLPTRRGHPGSRRPAWVASHFSATDDDLVCLQMEGPLPLPYDRVATLGGAADSQWNPFMSYGFRQLENYLGGWARGRILGEVDPPEGHSLLLDPVQLESQHIEAGMSGAPVLDVARNLVVGVVSETWLSGPSAKDRDTAWAVNADVVRFTPLSIVLREEPLPLMRAEQPVVDPRLTHRSLPPASDRLDAAPLALPEWVGRQRVLDALDRAASEGERLVAGLIGFGGEGKTSIARRWIDSRPTEAGQDGPWVFWWSFTERASANDFLEAALEFVSGGQIAADEFTDGRERAETVAALLGQRRFIFVLDGLESVQEQTGDQYGSIISSDLRDFLTFFATPGHESFCLITSRAPLADLAAYVTYEHIDVMALSVESGRHLLGRLGVRGSDSALDQVVRDWGGHALTLSLIAAYLVKRFGGDVRRVSSLPPPDPSLPRDEMVRRMLREYDTCLSGTERALLIRFSVFRTTVTDKALRTVLPEPSEAPGLEVRDTENWETVRETALGHLVSARIIRRDTGGRFGMHPLIRDFYQSQAPDDAARRALHTAAKHYYLGIAAEDTSETETVEALVPVVEAIHHACRSGSYEEACSLIHDRLYLGERGLMTRELNAYETVLSCFSDLFPRGEFRREPLVRGPESRAWVLHEVATCLQLLGRLWEAVAVMRRAARAFKAIGHWHEAGISCQNQAELHLSLGALPAAAEVIEECFTLAERADDREAELVAQTLRGSLAHYRGKSAEAAQAFAEALRLACEHTPVPALYSSSGVRYAEHLRREGAPDAARRVLETNLSICRQAGWRADEAASLIGLGDLALDQGDARTARGHYDEAFDIARGITRRDVLISALLARCRWAAAIGQEAAHRGDAEQALVMARNGGYRLAEIEIRLFLASFYHQLHDNSAAWDEISRAEEASLEIGYHWGQAAAQALSDRMHGD
ncbi:tetratricopeptide repeat protein [Streptomyces kebangsaanensis]|uniref:Tetratricopeptide repeat protein n=1 Tax=Streptomyces kebangsaanensis TaxID=864058 RepID=A0ABW6KMI5_9ACTN